MTSRFADVSRRWLKTAATTAATSALVIGGGIATAAAGHAANDHDGHDGHDGHEGGDACEFFLEHMWANEDGIPLLGSFAHVNEYHTDPAYENLVLSLASGAIGNSEMPIIDIYGGPLGWIPVFNPSHVKGHNTDYVTLLTSCGGIGIPLDSNDLTTLNVPSADELADLSDLIIPGLPTPEMLTSDYLWETTDASAILDRVTPETLLNLEEYVGFAGDHFDTWRLLWETALDDVTSGNPTGTLELLQITENINTLQSLSDVLGDDAWVTCSVRTTSASSSTPVTWRASWSWTGCWTRAASAVCSTPVSWTGCWSSRACSTRVVWTESWTRAVSTALSVTAAWRTC
ncbi:hypothetical protein [Nesterenkonia sp. PF2B19]|uniref:hypothetical protein n=1 Tax=Nesterenkonia sp. PF2B19 TaxID=1881858 RepID=UPI0008730FF0|nr:hypothetical protein [Nesterenkonia sp. PF2B19]OSM42164.1 hypothetical protein BCY76_016105 [Nesterenkonia sp. PF2B19]